MKANDQNIIHGFILVTNPQMFVLQAHKHIEQIEGKNRRKRFESKIQINKQIRTRTLLNYTRSKRELKK